MDRAVGGPYLLVSGAPRSGTTMLANILNSHKNVACLHEYGLEELIRKIDGFQKFDEEVAPLFNSTRLNSLSLEGSLSDFIQSRGDLTAAVAGEILVTYRPHNFGSLLASFFKSVSGKDDLVIFADKMPNSSYIKSVLPFLQKRLGRLRRVFIVRDPVNVIASSFRRGISAREGADKLWRPRSMHRAIQEWTDNWNYIVRQYQSNADDIHIIKYESLVSDFGTESEALSQFLGVENQFVNIVAPTPQHLETFHLSAEQLEEIHNAIGDLSRTWDSTPLKKAIEQSPKIELPLCDFKNKRDFLIGDHDHHKHMLVYGFSDLESWGVWTDDEIAEVAFKVDEPISKIILSLRPFFEKSKIFIAINDGFEVPYFVSQCSGFNFLDVELPVYAPSRTVRVRIRLLETKSMLDAPESESRSLGIALQRIRIVALQGVPRAAGP